VGPRADLYDVEKRKFLTLPGLELRPPLGRPARSRSLYRLGYPGSHIIVQYMYIYIYLMMALRRRNMSMDLHESMD
jgi:hypothetical protein